MVFDAKDQYPSQWAAIESIAGKIGCTGETLRKWVRQGERDSGVRPGPTTADQQRIKELERELRKTNEILKLASASFAQAELDRHHRK
jgi:transposase